MAHFGGDPKLGDLSPPIVMDRGNQIAFAETADFQSFFLADSDDAKARVLDEITLRERDKIRKLALQEIRLETAHAQDPFLGLRDPLLTITLPENGTATDRFDTGRGHPYTHVIRNLARLDERFRKELETAVVARDSAKRDLDLRIRSDPDAFVDAIATPTASKPEDLGLFIRVLTLAGRTPDPESIKNLLFRSLAKRRLVRMDDPKKVPDLAAHFLAQSDPVAIGLPFDRNPMPGAGAGSRAPRGAVRIDSDPIQEPIARTERWLPMSPADAEMALNSGVFGYSRAERDGLLAITRGAGPYARDNRRHFEERGQQCAMAHRESERAECDVIEGDLVFLVTRAKVTEDPAGPDLEAWLKAFRGRRYRT